MNGEQIIKEIDTRLIKLETKFEERWTAHNKQADEGRETICKKLDIISESIKDIYKRVNDTPCLTHTEQIKSLSKGINWIWSVVLSTVFSGVLLGIWIKHN